MAINIIQRLLKLLPHPLFHFPKYSLFRRASPRNYRISREIRTRILAPLKHGNAFPPPEYIDEIINRRNTKNGSIFDSLFQRNTRNEKTRF